MSALNTPLYIWTPSSRGRARGWCRWFPTCGRLSPGSWCCPLSGSGENSPPLHRNAPYGNVDLDLAGRPLAELWLWRVEPHCPCVSLCPPLVQFQSMCIPPLDASPVLSHTSETGPLLTWHPLSTADSQSAVTLYTYASPLLACPAPGCHIQASFLITIIHCTHWHTLKLNYVLERWKRNETLHPISSTSFKQEM